LTTFESEAACAQRTEVRIAEHRPDLEFIACIRELQLTERKFEPTADTSRHLPFPRHQTTERTAPLRRQGCPPPSSRAVQIAMLVLQLRGSRAGLALFLEWPARARYRGVVGQQCTRRSRATEEKASPRTAPYGPQVTECLRVGHSGLRRFVWRGDERAGTSPHSSCRGARLVFHRRLCLGAEPEGLGEIPLGLRMSECGRQGYAARSGCGFAGSWDRAKGVFFTVMGPPEFQGHGATSAGGGREIFRVMGPRDFQGHGTTPA
jgi:hypothetical protein